MRLLVTRLHDSILYHHAVHVPTSAKTSTSSWFVMIRELCYQLPHPLDLHHHPFSKTFLLNVVKSRFIIDHWDVLLIAESSSLPSNPNLKTHYMSLMHPHPLWSSCGSNPFEIHKAITAAKMLSGRYLTDTL